MVAEIPKPPMDLPKSSAASEHPSDESGRDETDRKMADWTEVVGRWTRRLTFATVAMGGIGIVATIWVGRLGDETQRAAQRPWMKFKSVELLEPIHCDHAGTKMSLRISIVGDGNSPALDVRPNTFLSTDAALLLPDKLESKMHKVCDQSVPDGSATFVAFPKADDSISYNQSVSATHLGVGIVPIWPIVVACISYKSSFDTHVHHTAEAWTYGPIHQRETELDVDRQTLACSYSGADFKQNEVDRTLLQSYAD
jgi:hypothetical protein